MLTGIDSSGRGRGSRLLQGCFWPFFLKYFEAVATPRGSRQPPSLRRLPRKSSVPAVGAAPAHRGAAQHASCLADAPPGLVVLEDRARRDRIRNDERPGRHPAAGVDRALAQERRQHGGREGRPVRDVEEGSRRLGLVAAVAGLVRSSGHAPTPTIGAPGKQPGPPEATIQGSMTRGRIPGRGGTGKPFTTFGTSHGCSQSATNFRGGTVPAIRVSCLAASSTK